MNCRFCKNELKHLFADLGASPPSNSFLTQKTLDDPEVCYPLRAFVCDKCFLVQLDECKKASEIFSNEYVYFSGVSSTWLAHAKDYVETITRRLGLGEDSFVVEIASNDGYLLQYVHEKGIPCLGIEPTANTAAVAKAKGISVWEDFFGTKTALRLARENRRADLLLGNNVLAHVPDINDFVAGMKIALEPLGTITMEFPSLLRLVEQNQFDTIYHEHFSYISFTTAVEVFRKHGLEIYDVDKIETHGGSLRIYARHVENKSFSVSPTVGYELEKEKNAGVNSIEYYRHFSEKMGKVKFDFLRFLLDRKSEGLSVVGYGAAAKGNTLLNYCGIKSDLIGFVCDRAESKQGKYLPGSRIPVFSEEKIRREKPEFIVVFPWNIRDEIERQLEYVREWGGKFVTVIPGLAVW